MQWRPLVPGVNTVPMASYRSLFRSHFAQVVLLVLAMCMRVVYAGERTPLQGTDATELIIKQINKIHALGYPTELKDLAQWTNAPPELVYVAAQWTNALASLNVADKQMPRLPMRNVPFTTNEKTRSRKLLKENQIALQKMYATGKLSVSRVAPGRALPCNTLALSSCEVQDSGSHAVELLQIQAMVEAEDHNSDRSLNSIETLSALATILQQESGCAGYVQGHLAWWRLCEATERLLAWNSPSSGQLLRLQALFQADQTGGFANRLLAVSLCLGLDDFRHWTNAIISDLAQRMEIDQDFVPLTNEQKAKLIKDFAGQREADLLSYLNAMEGLLVASKMSYPQFFENTKPIRVEFDSIQGHPIGRYPIYTTVALRPLYEIVVCFAITTARLRAAETAIACERFSRDHEGQMPEKLADLVPSYVTAVPEDPFDGNPLRFKRLSDSYVIYSIGGDFTDDGGQKTEKPPIGPDDRDVTFTLSRKGVAH